MSALLGCIAGDFTGAIDLARMLARARSRTVQMLGVPKTPIADVDAIVVALNSSTVPEAGLGWLKARAEAGRVKTRARS